MGKKQKLRCQHDSTYFDRTLCAEPCGDMHTSCHDCGYIFGGCYWLSRDDEPNELKKVEDNLIRSCDCDFAFQTLCCCLEDVSEYALAEWERELIEAIPMDSRTIPILDAKVTTHDDITNLIEDTLSDIQDLNNSKGREYATDADGLANFNNRAEQMGITPLQVWGIFYGKHSDAIFSYLKRGEVLSEPIEGRIDDAILYLVLLKALVREAS